MGRLLSVQPPLTMAFSIFLGVLEEKDNQRFSMTQVPSYSCSKLLRHDVGVLDISQLK